MEIKMVKNKPGLVKTGLEELTYKVNGLAMKVQHELKSGHPEKFYQRRLVELCRAEGLQIETEKRVEVWIGENMVGYLFLDLWIEDVLVVECKAFDHDLTNNEIGQVLTYLVATGASVGMLYNFGRNTLDFKRILPPKRVQEWQQYLYRCIWTSPGTSLPQIGSGEAGKPIVFSVAAQPSVSVGLPDSTSAEESVSVRLSASKSVEKSVSVRLSASKSAEESVERSGSVRLSASESVERSGSVRLSASESVERSGSVRLSASKSVDMSDYAASGVDIDAGNKAVELMKAAVKSTYGPEVLAGIGSFGGLFDASVLKTMKNPVLVASTDGVGTKVKLAAQASRYRSTGHDIVNHCIDDILVQGARPLFFLDYFATSRLVPEIVAEVVAGISEACREAGCALLGGETAEMPGVYVAGEFDLAGTIVGVLDRESVLPRPDIRPGDVLIGIRSSGPHTNGYSLIRKIFEGVPLDTVFPELGMSLADALLAPHRSYYPILYSLLSDIKALAHLTGGGFIENIPRVLPEGVGVEIQTGSWSIPALFTLIQQRGEVAPEEMYRVFNMGIGMVAIVDKKKVTAMQKAIPEQTFVLGKVVAGNRKVVLK
jgi:phosphoribosylformylglycinamidine cyclo-ligase